jgi:hypothetical protein
MGETGIATDTRTASTVSVERMNRGRASWFKPPLLPPDDHHCIHVHALEALLILSYIQHIIFIGADMISIRNSNDEESNPLDQDEEKKEDRPDQNAASSTSKILNSLENPKNKLRPASSRSQDREKMALAAARYIEKRQRKKLLAHTDTNNTTAALEDVRITIHPVTPPLETEDFSKARLDLFKKAKILQAKRGDKTYLGGHSDSVQTRNALSIHEAVNAALHAPIYMAYMRLRKKEKAKARQKEKASAAIAENHADNASIAENASSLGLKI